MTTRFRASAVSFRMARRDAKYVNGSSISGTSGSDKNHFAAQVTLPRNRTSGVSRVGLDVGDYFE